MIQSVTKIDSFLYRRNYNRTPFRRRVIIMGYWWANLGFFLG